LNFESFPSDKVIVRLKIKPKPRNPISDFRTPIHEPSTRTHETRTRIHEASTRIYETRTRIHEASIRTHEPRTPIHEARTRILFKVGIVTHHKISNFESRIFIRS
jgi:hypothetical protein